MQYGLISSLGSSPMKAPLKQSTVDHEDILLHLKGIQDDNDDLSPG